ncbi:MAG: hypothetical protein ACMUIG_05260 [Thermoplasmatota archaeon]
MGSDGSMEKQIYDYIRSIGIKIDITTEPLLDKVHNIFKFYDMVCPEEIEEVFISQKIDPNGNIQYEDVAFFSDSYFMIARDFTRTDDFFMYDIESNIISWNIKKRKFNFRKARDDSMMSLTFSIRNSDFDHYLRAQGENCIKLRDLFNRYVMTNME